MQNLSKLLFVITCCTIFSNFSLAQNGSLVVVNGGVFGSTNYANISIQAFGTSTPDHLDTIYTTSVQDLLVADLWLYVAAQDSIIRYDLDTRKREAATAFGSTSTIKMALHNNHLLVGNWYEPFGWSGPYPNHFRIFDAASLAFVDSIPEITKAVDDFVVIGNYAYIVQNNDKTVGWGDTLGYLAVVDLNNFSWVRNDTLSSAGDEMGRLVVEGNMIYSLNASSNTISTYNTSTQAKSTQAASSSLHPLTTGTTAYLSDTPGVWYLPFDNGIGSYNLATNTVVQANILTIPGSFAFALDTINNQFCVSHIDYGNQANNKGRIYDMNGDSVGVFVVGFSPELLAVIPDNGVAISRIADEGEMNFTIFPNPTTAVLNIEMENAEPMDILIINQIGQTVLHQKSNQNLTKIGVNQLAAGLYFVNLVNEDGVMRTLRFVKN